MAICLVFLYGYLFHDDTEIGLGNSIPYGCLGSSIDSFQFAF